MKCRYLLFAGVFLLFQPIIFAKKPTSFSSATLRSDCIVPTAYTQLRANKIRATLHASGDMWWAGGNTGGYIVPNVGTGSRNVSAIYVGAIWMGGFDPAGNLKLAAQSYGTAQGQTDYWSGPLNSTDGTTELSICNNWDKLFKVRKSEIETHLRLFGQGGYTESQIPKALKAWPAKGNPYFQNTNGFELPNNGQALADFFDQDNDGIYDPLKGDFPVLDVGCTDKPVYPEEMIFWIFNDNGGVHNESYTDAIKAEFHMTAFGFQNQDVLDYSTFYNLKFFNRAAEDFTNAYIGLWIDPDLGCAADDYIGCDSTRNLAYIYNSDQYDGETGCTCSGGTNTYCDEIPIIGFDFLRGTTRWSPKQDANGNVLIDPVTQDTIFETIDNGMSSFIYSMRAIADPPTGVLFPYAGSQYYNYLTGRFGDGTPMTANGIGYQSGGRVTKYGFHSPPDCRDTDCWSMCSENADARDRLITASSGPFHLRPGEQNQLTFGVLAVPQLDLPCPDIRPLLEQSDYVQALFDNCFELTPPTPDAPDLELLSLDRELVVLISNQPSSNNYKEQFLTPALSAPLFIDDNQKRYKFEGYKIFQLRDANVTYEELDDPSKAKLAFQTDLKNGVGKIYNWYPVTNPNPNAPPIWVPEEQVLSPSADSDALRHSVRIRDDLFASGDTRLKNNQEYHFMAVAYAHNDWKNFNQTEAGRLGSGQKIAYIQGKNNTRVYTARPQNTRPPDQNYGDVVPITRLDGVGMGGFFLDMTELSREKIITNDFDGRIEYDGRRAPIQIKVVDPARVGAGRFEITLEDNNLADNTLQMPANWRMTNLDDPSQVWISDHPISVHNEQLIPELGISVLVRDVPEIGDLLCKPGGPGKASFEHVYADDAGEKWFSGIPSGPRPFNYTEEGGCFSGGDGTINPDGILSGIGPGWFVPYFVLNYRIDVQSPYQGYMTPVWMQQGALVRQQMLQINSNKALGALNNVDIILTSDKSKWSRCVIVEATSPWISQFGLTPEGGRPHFELRAHPSVGKEDNDNDGLPDPDGDGEGMGWFPGYAIDVESGERLNIFFGEASIYRCDEPLIQSFDLCTRGAFPTLPTGADMMWNPTSQEFIETGNPGTPQLWQFMAGGLHHIYVTTQEYDGCERLRGYFAPGQSSLRKVLGLRDVTWAGFPLLKEGAQLLDYKNGLIPNDLIFKLRVDNPFQVKTGTGVKNGYPTYEFALDNFVSKTEEVLKEINPLDAIKIFPNPYCCAAENGGGQVQVVNIPENARVLLFDLQGRLLKNWSPAEIKNSEISWQPVASGLHAGVYFFKITDAKGNTKVLKWAVADK